jgi:hypothetical protein
MDRVDASPANGGQRHLRRCGNLAKSRQVGLIDSDILIEVSRAKDTAILARWNGLSLGLRQRLPHSRLKYCFPAQLIQLLKPV